MLGILIVMAIFIAIVTYLRHVGSSESPRLAIVQPSNTTAIMLTKGNTLKRDKEGRVIGVNNDGGDIVDVLSTAVGKVLIKPTPDPMDWHHVPLNKAPKGTARAARRGVLYYLFGLQLMWIFYALRINDIRHHRWGRTDWEDKYHLMAKTEHTVYAQFQRQHDIELERVETREIVAFMMRFNITIDETYPVRARMKHADSYAVFTDIVSDFVNDYMSGVDPLPFLVGDDESRKKQANDLRDTLLARLMGPEFRLITETETGLTIRKASLPQLDFDDKTRELLESITRARITGEALVVTATKAKEAKLQSNAAEADRIEKTVLTLATNDRTVAVAGFDALRHNTSIHTLAVGGGAQPVIPLGSFAPTTPQSAAPAAVADASPQAETSKSTPAHQRPERDWRGRKREKRDKR